MSLEAINEQLLRAVGVGIALFDGADLTLSFQNDVFATWFEEATPGAALATILPMVDGAALRDALADRGRHATEVSFRRRRRTLFVSLMFTTAQIGDQTVIVLECQNITRIRELESMIESYSAMVERNTHELKREKEQVEKLLLNLMPRAAYEEYKAIGIVAPQRFDDVSVLMLDIMDFSRSMQSLPPAQFVSELNELFGAFDKIGQQFGCERIKTTGGTYLCVAGMNGEPGDHRKSVAEAAVRFVRFLRRRNQVADRKWTCRIGLGHGPVVGSVVGVEKYVYDIFGEAVNAADEARRVADAMEVLAPASMLDALDSIERQTPLTAAARDGSWGSLSTA